MKKFLQMRSSNSNGSKRDPWVELTPTVVRLVGNDSISAYKFGRPLKFAEVPN